MGLAGGIYFPTGKNLSQQVDLKTLARRTGAGRSIVKRGSSASKPGKDPGLQVARRPALTLGDLILDDYTPTQEENQMKKQVKAVPVGHQTTSPYYVICYASHAITFYKRPFRAQ